MSLISTQANFGGRQPNYTSYIKQFISSPGKSVPWVFVKDGADTYIEPNVITYPVLIPQDVIMNGDLTVYGTFSNPSDVRLKTAINEIDREFLDRIAMLKPVEYKWKHKPYKRHHAYEEPRIPNSNLEYTEEELSTKQKKYGFIAQDVEAICPQFVKTNRNDVKTVNYMEFIPIMFRQIQDLRAQVEALETRLALLEEGNIKK